MKLFLATFLIPIVALAQGRVGITLETVSSLESRRAINGEVVNVLGFSQAGDWGGPKQFRWDATNTLSTNAIRRGTNAIGRWVHEWDGDATVLGVKADAFYNTNTASWDGTDDTYALQSAIDAAIDTGIYKVVLPPRPMLIQPPSGWTNNYILILSYNSFVSADPAYPRQSATYPSGRSDGWDRFENRVMEIVGTSPNEIAPVTAEEGGNRLIGSYLIVKGATNQYALTTGGFMAGINLSRFGVIGEGTTKTLGGIQVEVSTTNIKMEGLNISDVNTGVAIGTQVFDGAQDYHSDWTYLDKCTIQFVDTCVRIGAQNSYITRITHPKFRGRIGIDNRVNLYGASSIKINPQTTVNGGFVQADHGVIDGGNYYVSGVVTNVSGQDITLDASTLQKITTVYGVSSPSTNAGAMSDIVTNMLIGVYGNTILGNAREEVPAINRITNVSGSTLTLRGYVNTNNLVGKRFVALNPAVAFVGSNFRVYGTEVEYQQVNTRTMPNMLLWNESYYSTDIFDGLRFQNFPTSASNQSEMEMIWPRVYTEVPVSGLEGTLEFRGGIIRAAHFIAQVGQLPVKVQSMAFGTWPMFIEHNGSDAPGVVFDSCEFSIANRDNSTANKVAPIWATRGVLPKAALSNGILSTPFFYTEQIPAASGTSDLLVRPHQTPTIAQKQFGTITTASPHSEGYFDTASVSGLYTNDVTVDPYKITFGDFSTLYVGRVVSLSGAGASGAAMVARITDMGHDTNGLRFARIDRPAITSVTGGTIANTTTTLRGFGRQADFSGAIPQGSYQSVGDIVWKPNVIAGDPVGWVIPRTGATNHGIQIGIAGVRPLDYVTNLGFSISSPPTQGEVTAIRDAYNSLLAALQSNYLMMPATNSYGYTNVLTLDNAGNITVHDHRYAQEWVLREERAGLNTASLYWSVDAKGPIVLTPWTNLFGTGTNVSSVYSYRGSLHLTNSVGLSNSAAWESSRPALDFRDNNVELWMSRSSALNVGTAGSQTYQIRGLELYAVGDGAILKNNRNATNDMQIRISSVGSPYLRYYDASGVAYDFTFDRVRLSANRPTMLTFHINRSSHADLYVDGNFIQSVPLRGISAINIDSTNHGFATDSGQALRFFVTGLTAFSGIAWF